MEETLLAPSLPPTWYYAAEHYALEKENIFKKEWIFLCHTGELTQNGDYITCDVAGIPVIALRDDAGQLQILLNICRHRGAKLLTERRGRLEKPLLMCQYHGWCYKTDGSFKQAPFVTEPSISLDLKKIHWEEVQGLIFISFHGNPSSFAHRKQQMLDEMATAGFKPETYHYHSQIIREGRFNWKTWVEGFQECYHCPTIHPGFNKDFHLAKYKVFNKDHFSVHQCPRKVPSATGQFEGLWMWLYPNCGLPCYEKTYYSLRINPKSPTETELFYTFFTNDLFKKEDEPDFFKFITQITDEDIQICEQVQHNIEQGTGANLYDHGYLNLTRENGVHYFHELVRKAVGGTNEQPAKDMISQVVSL